ncbi:uncharacterized protein LOC116296094 [Actinia tenebrosa]|uniref:tRNA (adenine(58)-N(1))-methyltransferase n=1 Tax=Actinia tenebrosa TaxID=6105 RepID=A0A6P8HX62_ACTTE|nr:uncharacterized protein LOC116296094 [Actinia tenebrosa]
MKKIVPIVSKLINKIIHRENILKIAKGFKWREIFGIGKDSRAFLNLKTNPPFLSGEIVLVVESRFGGSSSLLRLAPGVKAKLKSRHGKKITFDHEIIIGREENGKVIDVEDLPFRVKRPSLEQYVLHMKRVATPSYPKDIQAMISMAEIGQGSVVLESGTGSGAMTLFLSRAVGKEGHVHSFDNNTKHMKNGKENFFSWINSWNKTKSVQWPENVTFHECSVKKCTEKIPKTCELDAALLDLQSPEYNLEYILPAVKHEGPIVIFLPSITQVVDVISSCYEKDLPFYVDNIIEVTHRLWKVQQVFPVNNTDPEVDGKTSSEEISYDVKSSVKYSAKPSFQQLPHTGFIIKLLHRKRNLERSIQNGD